jgi:Cu+-exporting ATPase
MSPLFAGAAMALSTLFVVSNSLRLRRFTPHRSEPPSTPARLNPRAVG